MMKCSISVDSSSWTTISSITVRMIFFFVSRGQALERHTCSKQRPISCSCYDEHRLRHQLDQLPLDVPIQLDFLFAAEIELKLLHAVPPALFEEQSHWALSSLDPLTAPSTAPEHSRSMLDWERSRFLMRTDEPSTEEFSARTHVEFEQ